MFRLLIGLVVLGGVLVFWGCQEIRVGSDAKSKPQEISVGKLVTEGYGDNAYVKLTDYVVPDDGVIETRDDRGSFYSKVWMVLYPKDEVPEGTPALILRSGSINNDREWDLFATKDQCEGLIVNSVDSLGSEEKKLLKKQLQSSIDINKAYVFDLDRKPSRGWGFLMMAGGALLIISPLGVLYTRGRQGTSE